MFVCRFVLVALLAFERFFERTQAQLQFIRFLSQGAQFSGDFANLTGADRQAFVPPGHWYMAVFIC